METKEKDKEMEIIRPSLSNTSCLERHINWLKLPEWLPGLLRGRTGLPRNIIRSLHCLFPNFDDCVTVCSNTIELEKLIWGRSLTFRDNSEVTDPDYVSKVHLCRAKIRAEQWLNPTQLSSLLTLEGNPGTVHGKLGADCICERHKSSPGLTCAVRKRSPGLTCKLCM